MIASTRRFSQWTRRSAIAVGAAVALLLPACAENQRQATTPENQTTTQTEANRTATEQNKENLEKVAEKPEQLIGQTVTVEGEVDKVYSPTAFSVQDDKVFGGDKVLVITPNGTTPSTAIKDDQNVQVTGEVRQFVVADFEREYNLTWDGELKKTIEAEYQNKPVIIAKTTQVSQR